MAESGPRSPLRIGRLRFEVRAWVYGTITLMSVLSVYDGWSQLSTFAGVFAIVTGPTVALALAHLFADVLDHQVSHSRHPTGAEWRSMLADSAQHLLVAVPLLVTYLIAYELTGAMRPAVTWMLVLGTASLGMWGYLAGRRVGYHGWALVTTALAGLLVGSVIILVQVLLKPH